MSLEEKTDWLIEFFTRNDVTEVPVKSLYPLFTYQSILEIVAKWDTFELWADESTFLLLLHYEEEVE